MRGQVKKDNQKKHGTEQNIKGQEGTEQGSESKTQYYKETGG